MWIIFLKEPSSNWDDTYLLHSFDIYVYKGHARGWESPWACEQCSLEDLWSVGSFQENLDLHTSFGRFFEKNVGKYPKDGNTFPTKVDFPRKLKKFPKWTSSYNNISSKSHKIMVGGFCSMNNACWKFLTFSGSGSCIEKLLTKEF